MAAFGAQCERILDKTARIPGQSYVCLFHDLDEHTICNKCIQWEDLCPSWADGGHVWVRCQRHKNHPHGHYSTLDGRPFTWTRDGDKADVSPAVVTLHGSNNNFVFADDFTRTTDTKLSAWSYTFTTTFNITF